MSAEPFTGWEVGSLRPTYWRLEIYWKEVCLVCSNLTVTNGAAADGFSEKINARFGSLTGNVMTGGGSVALLAAGSSHSSALTLGLSTGGTAGLKTGTVNVLFESDGTGRAGLPLRQSQAER